MASYIANKKAPYQDNSTGKHIITDTKLSELSAADKGFYTAITSTKTGRFLFIRKSGSPFLDGSRSIYLAESDYTALPPNERANYIQKDEFTEDEWRQAYR